MRKQEASFTVEASFIFTWIVFLIAAFLRMDFKLHDQVLKTASEAMSGLRYEQFMLFAYDSMKKEISAADVLGTTVLGTETMKQGEYEQNLYSREVNYFNAHRLLQTSEPSNKKPSECIDSKKNAQIVRSGTKMVELIGKDE